MIGIPLWPNHRDWLMHPDRTGFAYDPLTATLSDTLLKVLLALEPIDVTATRHTTMIKASITAYSTAVGPSSALTKLTTGLSHLAMDPALSKWLCTPIWPLPCFRCGRRGV